MEVGIYRRRNNKFEDKYIEILKHNNISYRLLNVNDSHFWQDIDAIDVFLMRWTHSYTDDYHLYHSLMPIVENEYQKICFPNMATGWHYDDKIKQYYLLSAHNFPVVKTHIFWDKPQAIEFVNQATYPMVFKLKSGSGSRNVLLVESKSEALKLTKQIFGPGMTHESIPSENALEKKNFSLFSNIYKYLEFKVRKLEGEDEYRIYHPHKNYLLLQEFLPNNTYDTRVIVVGDKACGFRRENRKGDFRASGSGLLKYDQNKIDNRCIQIAFDVSSHLGFQCMAYDFIYDEDEKPQICEISYNAAERYIYNAPGVWNKDLEWEPGHFGLQYLQLKSLLKMENLIQPESLV